MDLVVRCVVQRVLSASVTVGGEERGKVARGLLVLAGLYESDTEQDVTWTAEKVVNLRIFEDAQGKMNLSVLDIAPGSPGAGVLLVPNFTLAGVAAKGRRPSFDGAMRPERAGPMFDGFVQKVQALAAGVPMTVATGVFRAEMQVALTNDGPVTIILDSRDRPAG